MKICVIFFPPFPSIAVQNFLTQHMPACVNGHLHALSQSVFLNIRSFFLLLVILYKIRGLLANSNLTKLLFPPFQAEKKRGDSSLHASSVHCSELIKIRAK